MLILSPGKVGKESCFLRCHKCTEGSDRESLTLVPEDTSLECRFTRLPLHESLHARF